MAIIVNGSNKGNFVANNKQLQKIYANGVLVWENWVEKSGQMANLSTSSNSDWFTTSHATFSKPIIPKQVYCYFSYDYYSYESSSSTSYGGGFNYVCKDGTKSGSSGAPSAGVGGNGVAGRPSSSTQSNTTTFTNAQIEWFKNHGGIVECWYNGGGGTAHGTQSCGGYINGYLQKGS